MSDILKHILHPAAQQNDPNGNLLELGPWSAAAAEQTARELGIEMSDDHWDVVLFLRDHYRGMGEQADARAMTEALEQEFATDGGRKWLYKLFPGGPILQGTRIAGIPQPAGTTNPAFGNVH
jgi:tRNA 2-thiouridine synthesizing protein E